MKSGTRLLWLGGMGVWLIFVALGIKIPDSDFGWHFRLGEIIVKSGIPAKDPFSYTMPSYPFVDYEWGTDVLWYLLYPVIGMTGLASGYAAIAILAPFIALPNVKKEYRLWLAVLVWTVMVFRFGVRAQVISWLFTAVICRWIFNPDLWKRERGWYPWLLLVWANMHGSYVLGIVVMGVYLVINLLKNKASDINDWLYWGIGIAATLINPYGLRNWIEVIRQMGQAGLNSRAIGEWEPFWAKADPAVWLIMVLASVGWWRNRYKAGVTAEAAVSLIFIGGAALSLRHTPLLVIMLMPLAARAIVVMEEVAAKGEETGKRWRKFKSVMWGVAVIGLAGELVMAGYQSCGYLDRSYPVKAVEYLKNHKYPGRIFNRYGWGGYLVWQMPRERFFIDGRMSNFFWKAPPGESNQAFLEYLKIKWGQVNTDDLFEKYGVETVLWTSIKQPREVDLVGSLVNNGWMTVYRDGTAQVLVKPDKP